MSAYTGHFNKFNARRRAATLYMFHPVLSDEDVKNIVGNSSIEDMAAAILENGPPYSDHEVKILVKAARADKVFEAPGTEDDDTLAKYAEYIHNYKYTYKDDARKVDPTIDTSVEHNGPMAQDIEKVNPAAVSTDKSGYKVVDAQRVALMNAGAIADLAREVQELKNGRN